MRIVVDSNIIFSALLRTNTTFGQVIFNSDGIFDFFSAEYMRTEIRRHWQKLRKISRLTDQQLEYSYYSLLTKITFINEEIIPQKIWEEAEKLVQHIDPDDTDFVAMAKHLKGRLWTGDAVLRDGLRAKGYRNVMNTNDILKLWETKAKAS